MSEEPYMDGPIFTTIGEEEFDAISDFFLG